MITVKEEIKNFRTKFIGCTKKEFECPHCHQTLIFRTITVEDCGYCRKKITDVKRLMKDQDYRISYHAGLVD